MDVMFYQLLHKPLEQALPQLLEKTLQRDWKAVVQAGSHERTKMLDDHLWTYRQDSFLPHAAAGDGDGEMQPVFLTTGPDNPNQAHVRFFIDGADIVEGIAQNSGVYERAVLMFDGRDEEQLAAARAQWKTLKDKGMSLEYWQQKENGGWEKKA